MRKREWRVRERERERERRRKYFFGGCFLKLILKVYLKKNQSQPLDKEVIFLDGKKIISDEILVVELTQIDFNRR